MAKLKTAAEIEQMRRAGQLVAACHRELARRIRPGVSTLELNDFVERYIEEQGGQQYTKGYKGFPYATCASVNDVIAHGFPSPEPLRNGDIVKIDIVAVYDGWVGDSAWCYAVGDISAAARRLMRVTKECLDLGIRQAVPGNRIGDVTHAIQSHAEANGYSVVRDLLGHGVGRDLHEEPKFAHVGKPGRGFRLQEGMVITIEPMLNEGTHEMWIDDDGWTARTWDGRLSAQYEHTVAITKHGPVILTEQR
ncbi:type I methionyl aminopeptidase [Paenibacillus melissococcoides]|uniref:Methionine aminopeptidase n=1 Tax=Paenibacillus melissococcoides TaxID=2912268 RepID=A0ABM9G2D5_9BACL|nr:MULTISPECIES: type I methionyl aminopeptidase [Paenibacillus]MEB9897952.1 type I methionyl aminopeptidase [Bacillus cereus]CAH8245796.1 type I methionyl aminopeptidase [Paenibacillus melissococcoides]CAH8712111.1 type I methionyl aminopeptidase [Paenibacillus melissococcoides]CAH8712855.1 type I methionyl aminopeptidase [Paenibacillus melissococcoides]